MRHGIVYLVGAGPGDLGLITLRGLERLRSADVVLYDRLAAPELLREARPEAELIPCGKEPGRHAMPQDEINRTLVDKAAQGLRVCRLKGGDPTVFGRGAEEALELAAAGIPFEIVPGVSSAVAAGAYAGVPVTLRGVASSFAVVTGHEDPMKGESSVDWSALANAVDTIVVLMGVERAAEIAGELIAAGRSPETPVACVSRATTPDQSTSVTTLGGLAKDVREQGVVPPTVFMIGEVAALYPGLAWFEQRPLFGRRILVTRTREQAGELSRLLADEGAHAIEMPVTEQAPPSSWDEFDRSLSEMRGYDWIVFTSANAIRWVRQRLRELGLDVRSLCGPRIAAIGPKTAEALEQHGLRVDLRPDEHIAEGLVAAMAKDGLPGVRILLLRAEDAREVFPGEARNAGASVTVAPVYRTVAADRVDPAIVSLLEEGRIDAVTFASSSSVTHCVAAIGEDRARSLLGGVCVACIGPVTAGTAREHGLEVTVQPEEFTIPALVDALVRRLADRK